MGLSNSQKVSQLVNEGYEFIHVPPEMGNVIHFPVCDGDPNYPWWGPFKRIAVELDESGLGVNHDWGIVVLRKEEK
jgi:hypothetical protein